MRVVMADQGIAFDGKTPGERPLGGAESAFVALAGAFAQTGAEVFAHTQDGREFFLNGVQWRGVAHAFPENADLYIANRNPKLVARAIKAKRRIFWLHNDARFLTKPRYLMPLVTTRPDLVFVSQWHATTAPRWIPAGPRRVIGLGVEAPFLETPRSEGVPKPRALFVSDPRRNLKDLARIWAERIKPNVPDAELHVFSGPGVYLETGERAALLRAILDDAASKPGIVLRDPIPKAQLAQEFAQARTLLYWSIPETFCLAVAEAQAMGVPAVVRPLGAVGERVAHGVTGYAEMEEASFAQRAITLLRDDSSWSRMSGAALATRANLGWRRAAEAFLSLA